MERPSHINLQSSHTYSSRLGSFGLAVSLPAIMLWALAYGTVGGGITDFGPIIMARVKEPVQPRTPPPEPTLEHVVPLTVVQPIFTVVPEQKNSGLTTSVTPSQPKLEITPSVTPGPDRALAPVASTHTIPPYPALAQRLGETGKVTLRLTVLADGAVGKADIVTSAGSKDLDEAAQKWIVAHWTYKPALEKGQPVTSQTTVTVNFNLNDQR